MSLSQTYPTVVGLDVAWAHIGWCIIRDDTPKHWGVINTDARMEDVERVHQILNGLDEVLELTRCMFPADPYITPYFVAETTDWHQRGYNRQGQAREREAQRSLAMGITSFLAWSIHRNVEIDTIPVHHWQTAFAGASANSKIQVAKFLALQYPAIFEYKYWQNTRKKKGNEREERLFDKETQKPLTDHESDAAGIGLVWWREMQAGVRQLKAAYPDPRQVEREPAVFPRIHTPRVPKGKKA